MREIEAEMRRRVAAGQLLGSLRGERSTCALGAAHARPGPGAKAQVDREAAERALSRPEDEPGGDKTAIIFSFAAGLSGLFIASKPEFHCRSINSRRSRSAS
jgi:hypothetical protein